MLAASDIDSVPADIFKYIMLTLGWLVSMGGAAWGGVKLARKGSKDSPVAIGPQPFAVEKHDATARKSELAKLETSIAALAEQIAAQFNEVKRAGEARAAAITESLDAEVGTLSVKIGNLADALHEKINTALVTNAKQAAEIASLQGGEFRHNGEISRIQEHIADLIARPICSHRKP